MFNGELGKKLVEEPAQDYFEPKSSFDHRENLAQKRSEYYVAKGVYLEDNLTVQITTNLSDQVVVLHFIITLSRSALGVST